jgi:protein-tyrosine-phosphatase
MPDSDPDRQAATTESEPGPEPASTSGSGSASGSGSGSGSEPGATRVAFVCVENAGRSQMAGAFAERERRRRGLADRVTVVTGGTDPAERVHEVVVEAMAEVGIDLSDAEPRAIGREGMLDCEYVLTMGCSADDVCPMTWRGDARDWALDDPAGRPLAEVREIRDEIERRIEAFFDEGAGEDGGSDGEDEEDGSRPD